MVAIFKRNAKVGNVGVVVGEKELGDLVDLYAALIGACGWLEVSFLSNAHVDVVDANVCM